MITQFSTLYIGHIDLENTGFSGTRVEDRRYSNERLIEVFDTTVELARTMAIVAGGPRDYVRAHPSAAALVVEAADSSLRLDRRLKSGLYARAGLPEYWIANLIERVLEVHRQPQPAADAPYGWVYRSVEILCPPAAVVPVAAPGALILAADLLP